MAVNLVKLHKVGIHLLKNKEFNKLNIVLTKPSVASQKAFSTITLSNFRKTKLIPSCFQVPFANQWQFQNFSTSNNNLRKGDFQNSRDDGNDRIRNPGLMDFPEIAWPSPIKSIKNYIFARFFIALYFENGFSLDDFSIGARKAFVVVSRLLQTGNLNELNGLLTPEAIQEINSNYKSLTPILKRSLSVTEDDIYFSFPYQVGIIMDNIDGIQKRFVEITFCYHCLLGLQNLNFNRFGSMYNEKDKIFIANCRFIKEYTKGMESDWSINVFNVFKPAFYN